MSLISTIDLGCSQSFESPFLTVDVDWAHDEILEDAIDLVSVTGASCTWMLTHKTDLADDLSRNPRFEIGLHPNFNDLLEGTVDRDGGAAGILDRLLNVYPEARTVRSHSVTQSARLSSLFFERGIRFESNDYIPAAQISFLQPWSLENGITKVPFFYSDQLVCASTAPELRELVSRRGLKVFNFHPIHIFLNTESLDRYERTRSLHTNPKELFKYRYNGYGTRNRFIELLELIKDQ